MTGAALSPKFRVEQDRLYITNTPLFPDYWFVRPEVLVEFGARSTGEPYAQRLTLCDPAPTYHMSRSQRLVPS